MTPDAVSFDCFGTLVDVDTPADPAAAVADELRSRGVSVPGDWDRAYRTPHVDAPPGAEIPLSEHVEAILRERSGEDIESEQVEEAVLAAFRREIRLRPGVGEAITAAEQVGPVGVLSNCSIPGLVGDAMADAGLESTDFDAVVTSVDCGWRKPDPRAFETVASRLETPLSGLVHVGDDPDTDGAADDAGATAVLLEDVPLESVPEVITADP